MISKQNDLFPDQTDHDSESTHGTQTAEQRNQRRTNPHAYQADRHIVVAHHSIEICRAFSAALERPISRRDFDPLVNPLFALRIAPLISSTAGLVKTWVSYHTAHDILHACNLRLARCNGYLLVDSCRELGGLYLPQPDLTKLLFAAENLSETLVFYPERFEGAVVIDCYASEDVIDDIDFSIFVQGAEMVDRLRLCFDSLP